jgi:hypothetical protein
MRDIGKIRQLRRPWNFFSKEEYAGQPHKGRKANEDQGVGSTNSTEEGG